MAIIQSVLFWGFVGISSIALFPVAALIRIVTWPFDRRLKVLHRFTSFWSSLYTWFNPFWNVKVEGREKIDHKASYVIVSNHQSSVDIFAMFRIFAHFKWVSKKENFKIPVIGWNMRLNKYIEIDRGSVRGSDRMMRDCETALKQGSSVMIFPEGTRSETGEMRPFKRGAFELAMRTGSSILLIAITGSARALPKKGVMLKGRHNIHIQILDPVPTNAASTAQELSDSVRSALSAELARRSHAKMPASVV